MFVHLGAFCGLRLGELLALRPEDFSSLNKQVYVRRNLYEPPTGDLVIGLPKTESSISRVDVPDYVMEEVREHIQKWPGEWLFTVPDGSPVRPNNFRNREWNSAADLVGLKGVTPHILRHTFISHLIDQGVPVQDVAAQARHASTDMTWRTYRHQIERANRVSATASVFERLHKGTV